MRLLAGCLALALAASCKNDAEPAAPNVQYPEKDRAAEARRLLTGVDWYRHAVFYEVNVRSFVDSNGDGIGDLKGLISKLDDLKALGVDALWLMPMYPTPFIDSGYDIADYVDINKDYGTLAEFDTLVKESHARGIRVMTDLVLNHTSDEHAWFKESRSSKDNPKADWYIWSDTPGKPDIGCGTVNDTFGKEAWKLDPTKPEPKLNSCSPPQAHASLTVSKRSARPSPSVSSTRNQP